MSAPYIGSAPPAKVVVTDGQDNLFDIAARELGDPLLAWQLASLNGLTDFWPPAGVDLAIPRTPAPPNDGLPPN